MSVEPPLDNRKQVAPLESEGHRPWEASQTSPELSWASVSSTDSDESSTNDEAPQAHSEAPQADDENAQQSPIEQAASLTTAFVPAIGDDKYPGAGPDPTASDSGLHLNLGDRPGTNRNSTTEMPRLRLENASAYKPIQRAQEGSASVWDALLEMGENHAVSLYRRQAVVAGVALLALVVVAMYSLPQAFRSDPGPGVIQTQTNDTTDLLTPDTELIDPAARTSTSEPTALDTTSEQTDSSTAPAAPVRNRAAATTPLPPTTNSTQPQAPAAPSVVTTSSSLVTSTEATQAPPSTVTSQAPTLAPPTTEAPSTSATTTTEAPTTTKAPTTKPPTTKAPTTKAPTSKPTTTKAPTTTRATPTTKAPTTKAPTTKAPTTTRATPTTKAPTTKAPTTTRATPTTKAPRTTKAPTTEAPEVTGTAEIPESQ